MSDHVASFVIYRGHDEVIVCKPDNERGILEEYFQKGGRNLEDYDRTEARDVVVIDNVGMRTIED